MPLNFANIIALPLLLGVGVAFKIYYIMAWRAGQTNLLQSSLTRAVILSALTTATAFGSLWLSSHPGTSSMGKLLALSLVCTLGAAVLFQPALMGKPREIDPDGLSAGRSLSRRAPAALPRSSAGAAGAVGAGPRRRDGYRRPASRRRRGVQCLAAAHDAEHAAFNAQRVGALSA